MPSRSRNPAVGGQISGDSLKTGSRLTAPGSDIDMHNFFWRRKGAYSNNLYEVRTKTVSILTDFDKHNAIHMCMYYFPSSASLLLAAAL